MILKRFFFAAVIFYALLSLLSPHFFPVRIVEVTALLLSRPWESLLASFFNIGAEPEPASYVPEENERNAVRNQWWRPVLSLPPGSEDMIVLGGRVRSILSEGVTRLKLDMGGDPPVRSGDPVVRGNVLVGFVENVLESGLIDVLLLRHRASRVVACEVREGIAGDRIVFALGGECAGRKGQIKLQYPSSRYGLSSDTRVYTSAEFNGENIPAGLYVGRVSVMTAGMGEPKIRAGVLPAIDGVALSRLGVVVPGDRAGAADRPAVPELPMRRIPVTLSSPPGFLRPGTVLRISAGLEAGISRGNMVVSGGYGVGRITETGILTARADLLLAPEEKLPLVRLAPGGVESVTVRVEKRSGTLCRLEATARAEGLEKDALLFLQGDAHSGEEFFPICSVLDPGDGRIFTVRCGDVGSGREGFCIKALSR